MFLGICTNSYGCVIGEFGVRSQQGKPYPSTGFILATKLGPRRFGGVLSFLAFSQ